MSVGSPPVITAFTGSTTITSGSSAVLQATSGGGNGVITPGNIPILSGGSVVVAPASTTPYRLTVTNPTTGASVASGTAPPDVTVTVAPAPVVNACVPSSGRATSLNPLTFSIDATGVTGNASVTGACSPAATVAGFSITLAGGLGTSGPQAAPAVAVSSLCTYSATVQNAAATSEIAKAVVRVEPPPTISSFQFQSTGTQTAFFALHDDVVLVHAYSGGTATINGVAAGTTTTTFLDLRADTDYTLTVTNPAGKSVSSAGIGVPRPGNLVPVQHGDPHRAQGSHRHRPGQREGADRRWREYHEHASRHRGGLRCDRRLRSDLQQHVGSPGLPHGNQNPTDRGEQWRQGSARRRLHGSRSGDADHHRRLLQSATNSFASTSAITAGTVSSARARHVAVLLGATGVVLIAGGTSDDGVTILKTALKYNAGVAAPTKADVWNTMALARMNFTGTLLGSNSVLIVGGRTGNPASRSDRGAVRIRRSAAERSRTREPCRRVRTSGATPLS